MYKQYITSKHVITGKTFYIKQLSTWK